MVHLQVDRLPVDRPANLSSFPIGQCGDARFINWWGERGGGGGDFITRKPTLTTPFFLVYTENFGRGSFFNASLRKPQKKGKNGHSH